MMHFSKSTLNFCSIDFSPSCLSFSYLRNSKAIKYINVLCKQYSIEIREIYLIVDFQNVSTKFIFILIPCSFHTG